MPDLPFADLSLCRARMGHAATTLLTIDGGSAGIGTGSWWALTGLPSADTNVALVHEGDERWLTEAVGQIDRLGCPAALMLAGDGRTLSGALSSEWAHAGAMPIMTVELASTPTAADPRVRRALTGDGERVVGLISNAFGLDPSHVEPLVSAVLGGGSPGTFWLLEDDGEAVSTVLSGPAEDSVTLWCMATPPEFARRGYGRSLLAAVLHEAAAAGASNGILGATPAGEPLYRATGWTVAEEWDVYVNAASAQFG